MSRIGLASLVIENGVTVTIADNQVTVQGTKGTLVVHIPPGIIVEQEGGTLHVKRAGETLMLKAQHGTTRALIANAIVGVSKGWDKSLEMIGVGYRSQTNGKELTLTVGFSHPVKIQAPEGIAFVVVENKITVSGSDKKVVGELAATIRNVRPPEPYKGKGIRYVDEHVRKKAGKSAKTGAAAG